MTTSRLPALGPGHRRLGRHRHGLRARTRGARLVPGPDRPARGAPAGAGTGIDLAPSGRGARGDRRPGRSAPRCRCWSRPRAATACRSRCWSTTPATACRARWSASPGSASAISSRSWSPRRRPCAGTSCPACASAATAASSTSPRWRGWCRARRATRSTRRRRAISSSSRESLALENRGHGIHVTACCPGFTHSEFHDVVGVRQAMAGMPKWMWLEADAVARESLDAVERGQVVRGQRPGLSPDPQRDEPHARLDGAGAHRAPRAQLPAHEVTLRRGGSRAGVP